MMQLQGKTKDNVVAVVTHLIELLHLPVTRSTINEMLLSHPDHPSLLAVSDCLTEWRIPNSAYKLDKAEYNKEDMITPYIAHTKEDGGRFILIERMEGETLYYADEKGRGQTITEKEFLNKWDGIVLSAEPGLNSGEIQYKKNKQVEQLNALRLPLLVAVLAGVLLFAGFGNIGAGFDWNYSLLFVFKFVGTIVSVLLLMHTINANNSFVQNLCSLGKKNDCNAILGSDAAKVTSWLSWSEVGFFYFAGTLLALLFVKPESATLQLLALVNIVSLPYSFYSIYYQAFVVKKWCVLCCTVQALLWLEFICLVPSLQLGVPALGMSGFINLLLMGLLPIAIWSFLKPFMLRAQELPPAKQQLKRFKYNSELFEKLLTSQARFAVPQELMPIVLGNTSAETVITMVSNPYCGPCAKAHETLDEWLSYRDDIQLKVVFTTADHDDDPKTKVARHLTALSKLEDKAIVEKALNAWYQQQHKDFDAWAKIYPVTYSDEMNAVLANQKEWCTMAEIKFTPTILINGYKLPEQYRLEDIKYLLN